MHYLLMLLYISGYGIRKGLINSGEEAALCRPLIPYPVSFASKGNATELLNGNSKFDK